MSNKFIVDFGDLQLQLKPYVGAPLAFMMVCPRMHY